jgi:hypothetical protein
VAASLRRLFADAVRPPMVLRGNGRSEAITAIFVFSRLAAKARQVKASSHDNFMP